MSPVLMAEGILYTLPETNIAPENRPSPKRNFIFQPVIFKGYDLLVSGRVVPNKKKVRRILMAESSRRFFILLLLHLFILQFSPWLNKSGVRCETKLDIKKWKGGDQVVVT